MRIAIISDIHGNATAFEAVLADIDTYAAVEAIYCLGDNVGYGPEPEKVMTMIREHRIPTVLGNHELAINQPEALSWFNPVARKSLEKTMALLSPAAKEVISELPTHLNAGDKRFVHGFPPDSPTTYLFEVTPERMAKTFHQLEERLTFIGHTHELMLIDFDGTAARSDPLHKGCIRLDTRHKYIINVGSVGQPRDGNKAAKYVIWDDAADELTVRFVEYDVNDTVQKIYQAGLPEQHAWRLL